MAEKKVPKLHELLAALGDAEAKSKLVQNEAKETFSKRTSHFHGGHKTLKMFDDAEKPLEAAGAEHQELTTTVGAKLAYIEKDIARWWDAFLQKEATNQEARAELVLDDVVLGGPFPAAFFLGLEKELKELRRVYEEIPTLQPGIKWEYDDSVVATDGSKGIYRNMNPDKKLKTRQVIKHDVIVPPTDNHPAQVEKWTEQMPVGEFTQENFSGVISSSRKSELLGRISKLIEATKRARMRANDTPIRDIKIGKTLFAYINEV